MRHILSDGFLRRVADEYRAYHDYGLPPAKSLMDEHGVARRTVAYWISKARERGFLPPR